MYMSTQNGCSPATFLIETESHNTYANFEQNMAEMASNGPSPHSLSLRLGLPAPQLSRRHHAQSLLGPSFHDPRTHHVLEPPRASCASLPPQRWAMTRHQLSLRPCTAPPSCSLQPLLKLSLLSLGPSLLQFVSIVSPLLNHGNPIFEPVYVFLPFPWLIFLLLLRKKQSSSFAGSFMCSIFCLCFSEKNELQL